MHYWILKTEPDAYSLDDLARHERTRWDGVRNWQARNFIRDDMLPNDIAFLYHSNIAEPGIVGEAQLVSAAYPDPSARDPRSPYYDPKDTPEKPRWYAVDVAYRTTYSAPLPLAVLRADPQLATLLVAKRGNRLSVSPVDAQAAARIRALARRRHATDGYPKLSTK